MTRYLFVASALTVFLTRAWPADGPYEKWLNEDVVYIVTGEEREAWSHLATDQQRELFVQRFWSRRDPTPGTLANEFQEEHYRRIAYANARYATTAPGWQTDRGRIYIVYGPPDEVESHPSGTYRRPPEQGGGATSTYPFEIWRYRAAGVTFEFIDPNVQARVVMRNAASNANLTAPPGTK